MSISGASRKMKLIRVLAHSVCLLYAFAGFAVYAQSVLTGKEILAKDRPEAWAMKLVGSELQLTLPVPSAVRQWSIAPGLELGWIPSLNAQQRLIGFNGTKEEKINRTPAYFRGLAMIGLPWRVSLGLGYIPPVRIEGIRPNHLTWSLGRPIISGSPWRIGGTVHGQIGSLRGDITCDAETVAAGPDAIRNPFGCEAPSNDEVRIRAVGAELGGAYRIMDRIEPYMAVGWNYFTNDFQVNARYSGIIDRTLLVSSGPTAYVRAGAEYHFSERIRLGGNAYYTPLQVRRQSVRVTDGLFNVRFSFFYALR